MSGPVPLVVGLRDANPPQDPHVVQCSTRAEAEALFGKGAEQVEWLFPRPSRPPAPPVEPEPPMDGPVDIFVEDKSDGAAAVMFVVVTDEDTGRDSSYDAVQSIHTTRQGAKNAAGYVDGWVEIWAVRS